MSNLQLSNGEFIIKEFNYAKIKSKNGGEEVESLIITNKRIISDASGARGFVRKEIPSNCGDFINTAILYPQSKLIAMIICGVLSLICLIVGIVAQMSAFIGIGLILLVFFGILLYLFLKYRNSLAVVLEIISKDLTQERMSIHVNGLTRSKKAGKIKINVSKDIAEEMVNEIGAIILNIKENNITR